MPTTNITVHLTEAEKQLLADHAKTLEMSISEFMRRAALAHVEDELDRATWEDAKHVFDADPQTLTADEVASKHL